MADDSDVELQSYKTYDNVLLFSPQVSVPADNFKTDKLIQYFDDGHNIFVAADQLTKKHT